ncbi:MAG: SAM-dependent methyltransferase [Pelagibacteraceae bacterium]|nr:SAM-dependent methyltransferase [Pelagibacteraceae bacterium]
MFGLKPSVVALTALKKFEEENIKEIIELGAGLGRDTVFFAKNKIKVEALDYSPTAIKIIKKKAKDNNFSKLVSTKHFDVRNKLPYKDNSIKGIFSHMLYCMALTNSEVEKLNNEILRVLKPGGINIYTVRNIYDGDYMKGIHIGEEMYENDGFIINFFSEKKVNGLLNGFKNLSKTNFEEGSFPRKLFLIQNKKI